MYLRTACSGTGNDWVKSGFAPLPSKKAGVKQYPAVTIELERNTGQEIPGIITVVSFLNDVIYCC